MMAVWRKWHKSRTEMSLVLYITYIILFCIFQYFVWVMLLLLCVYILCVCGCFCCLFHFVSIISVYVF